MADDRIIYLQGFYQAYGIDKEAQLPKPQEPLLPEDIGLSHFGDFLPEGPIDFEDRGTQEKIQGGNWDYRLDFFGQPANPHWLPRAAEFTTKKLLPKLPFYPDAMKNYLGDHYHRAADAKAADIMAQVKRGDWSGVKKAWLRGTLETRRMIAAEFNKMKKQNTEKAKAAWKAKASKGIGVAALGAAAIGIPALMGMWNNNAASSNAASNTIDPRVEELRKHVAARQPGAVFRLSEESTPSTSSTRASSLYERLMKRYTHPTDSA